MPKNKEGEEISWKEFFLLWKKGIENLTPIQKLKNETRGTFLTLLGFLFSLIAVIWFRKDIGLLAYGLILIFIGSSWTMGVKYISLRQQLKLFKNMDSISKKVNEELNYLK